MSILSDVGVLPTVEAGEAYEASRGVTKDVLKNDAYIESQAEPWFEEIIEGSELGRLRRRRGGKTSADGNTRVEWEIVDFNDEEGDTGIGTGKRKIGEFEEGGGVVMRSRH